MSNEGLGQRIINQGINKSDFVYSSSISGDVMVSANNKHTSVTSVPALFGGVYCGTNGNKYILITNKSGLAHKLNVKGLELPEMVDLTYISAPAATTNYTEINEVKVSEKSSELIILPYSVNRIEWQSEETVPSESRIYDVKIGQGEVHLKWWTKENAEAYVIYYGTDKQNLTQTVEVEGTQSNTTTIANLSNGSKYFFLVRTKNQQGESVASNLVDATMSIPQCPMLVSANGRTEKRLGGIVTLLWRSVPDAHGYKIKYGTQAGIYTDTLDAGNVSGFRLSNLPADKSYYMSLVSYNGYGESETSNELNVTTTADRPVAPHQVRLIEDKTTGHLTIQWEESLEFAFDASYDIYRSDKVYTDYELVEEGVTGSSFTFNPKEKPGTWFYKVIAKNENW